MKKGILVLCMALVTATPLSAQTTLSGSIKVQVEGVERLDGQVIVSLYKESKGFPTKPEMAFRQYRMPVENIKPEILLTNLPFETYAIAVYHDENGDEKFNTNILGIPKEKTGASNNPKALFVPSFEQAKFELSQNTMTITIQIK